MLEQVASGNVVMVTGLIAAALILAGFARRVAKAARPDDLLSRVAVVLGLGWSSEAAWELMAGFPIGLRVAIFAVGEVILVVSMIRTARSVREDGRAGRSGQAVWIVASAMAVVGLLAAANPGQGVLRALVPLGLTLMWWQGVVPEAAKRADGPSSWRWTPRRMLLAVGALEPGERDVETVHRERLTQQLTKLEFRRQAATGNKARRLAARLARLSLLADDEMIAVVRRRVARASWFTAVPLTHLDAAADAAVTQGLTQALTLPPRRTKASATSGLTSGDAGVADPATRAAQMVLSQRVSNRRAADECGTSEASVRRALAKLTQDATQPARKVNGNAPNLARL